ncbi:glycosyltransferase family 2 protein [uncultured Bacteroides sp.]|uniref:glycosyltransferase family 2 protein n=1 Tax=uncultured Bacteroides sp. TaxID=162156 RepID=UPI002675D7AC|nr:glycosyltransferase family 2 protein [uncultured Bacteroides sp.]
MLSVICPIYNEEKYIAKCIDSILEQDYPKDDLEILFVDGMSTDRTREIVKRYIEKYSFIRLFDNPKKIVPPALNIAIRASKGNVIIRLDAHAFYPQNYFSLLVKKLNELQADNVGGVCRTLPINNTPKCVAIAKALSSSFGMGNSYFRIGVEKEMQVDTVPFGCFRRYIFDKIGMFDEELIRNQDDEFNGRIIKNGGKIFLIPSLVIDYFARDKIQKVWKMFYQYGLFKPLVNKKLGSPASVRQFFPLVFVVGLILGMLICWIHPILVWLYFGCIALYLLLAIVFASKDSNSVKVVFWIIISYITVHVGYGYGYLRGIFKLLFHQNFVVKANR